MATPNYDINYNDKRFTEVESDKKAALSDLEKTYAGMINSSDSYYQAQINANKQWEATQKKNQQAQTDFAIQQIEQKKDQAVKDYHKEQSASYVDWQKQSGQYGANAEQMAAQGMQNTGFAESSQVAMYNQYQNRVAVARDAIERAKLDYDNQMTEARLQNNSILAEIAYNAYKERLALSLEGFQYKNQLILDKTSKKQDLENQYYSRYQDVLKQINTENAMKEEVRQYNESLAEQKRQHNATIAAQNAQLALEREKFAFQKQQYADSKASSSSGGSGGTIKESSSKKSTSSSKKKGAKAAGKDSSNIRSSTSKASFSGSTYSEAVKYMEKRGVPSSYASNVMTKGEWSRGRKKGYDSYADYLKDYTAYAVSELK